MFVGKTVPCFRHSQFYVGNRHVVYFMLPAAECQGRPMPYIDSAAWVTIKHDGTYGTHRPNYFEEDVRIVTRVACTVIDNRAIGQNGTDGTANLLTDALVAGTFLLVELSSLGTKVLWNFHSLELSSPGTFVHGDESFIRWNFCSLEFSI